MTCSQSSNSRATLAAGICKSVPCRIFRFSDKFRCIWQTLARQHGVTVGGSWSSVESQCRQNNKTEVGNAFKRIFFLTKRNYLFAVVVVALIVASKRAALLYCCRYYNSSCCCTHAGKFRMQQGMSLVNISTQQDFPTKCKGIHAHAFACV